MGRLTGQYVTVIMKHSAKLGRDAGSEVDRGVAAGTEAHDRTRHAKAWLRVVELQDLGVSRIAGLGELGRRVEQCQDGRMVIAVRDRASAPSHPTAAARAWRERPGRERGSAGRTRGHAGRGCRSAGGPRSPRRQRCQASPADEERVPRHVERVESDPVGLDLRRVELGVDEPPRAARHRPRPRRPSGPRTAPGAK